MTIKEMLESVVGYTPHTNPIDIKVATDALGDCGHKMSYRGWKRGNSYRAFAICEQCDVAEEF